MSTKYSPTPAYYENHGSERLVFRPFETEDIERWVPFFDEPAGLSFVGMNSGKFKTMPNAERSKSWIEKQIGRQQEGVFGQLAVIEKVTGAFLGVGGLIFRNELGLKEELEITYSLLPEARGKGYATELSLHFKKWAFEHTSIPSVISIVHVENLASINVTHKNGMLVEKEMDYFEMPVRLYRVRR